MNSSQTMQRSKQHRVAKQVRKTDSYDFFNMLTSDALLSVIEGLLPEHTERLFSPTETVSMFLAQALDDDRSCQKAVNNAAVKRVVGSLPRCSTGNRGVLQSKAKLAYRVSLTACQDYWVNCG